MKKVLLIISMLLGSYGFSQSLHPLEPSKNHYLALKKLNDGPNAERSSLDGIHFTPNEYKSLALSYILMTPVYLTHDQIIELKKGTVFPANSSDQTQAELEFLLDWQKKRTAAQVQRAAQFFAPIGYWPHINVMKDHPGHEANRQHAMFEGRTVLGEECTAENYPKTFALLQGVTQDMRIMEFTVKYHLLRPRPYVLERKLKPLAIMGSPSYASGHTLWAYIQAFVWSELLPDKRKAFLDLAYEIGESREIMGIHYPSDEEAARVLAHEMLSNMWSNPRFETDFKAAQSEWRTR